MKMEGGGMFGNMWEKAMLKIVEVKEKQGAKKKLQVVSQSDMALTTIPLIHADVMFPQSPSCKSA